MMAVGMNVVFGWRDNYFFGPTALFAAGGAYLAAYLAVHFPVAQHFWVMCLVAVAALLVVAAVAAVPALRVGGFYLGMVTLFLALVIPLIAGNVPALGGSSGLSLISSPTFVQRPTGIGLLRVGTAHSLHHGVLVVARKGISPRPPVFGNSVQ